MYLFRDENKVKPLLEANVSVFDWWATNYDKE